MGLFMKSEIDQTQCVGFSKCSRCLKVCPVQIFAENGDQPAALPDTGDECTLCNLCLDG